MFFSGHEYNQPKTRAKTPALNFSNMVGLWSVAALGLLIATGTFITELVLWKAKKIRK